MLFADFERLFFPCNYFRQEATETVGVTYTFKKNNAIATPYFPFFRRADFHRAVPRPAGRATENADGLFPANQTGATERGGHTDLSLRRQNARSVVLYRPVTPRWRSGRRNPRTRAHTGDVYGQPALPCRIERDAQFRHGNNRGEAGARGEIDIADKA